MAISSRPVCSSLQTKDYGSNANPCDERRERICLQFVAE